MGKYNYYFDTLLAAVNLRKIPTYNKKDLKVDVSFPKATLNISPSRLNLLYFCPNTGTTFEGESETLREELEKNELKVTVYLKEAIVGEALIPWPKRILDHIEEVSDVLVDGANAELKLNDEVVGCVEVIVRLQCLCGQCEEEFAGTGEEGDEEENGGIGQDDIMFIMDDSEKCGNKDKSVDLDKECKLDLAKYREINGKTVLCPGLKNMCTSPQCLNLKDMSGKLEKIVQQLVCDGIQDLRVNKKPVCGSPCSPDNDSCSGRNGGGCNDSSATRKSIAAPCGSSFAQSKRFSGMSTQPATSGFGSNGKQNCSDKKRDIDCSAPQKTMSNGYSNSYAKKPLEQSWLKKSKPCSKFQPENNSSNSDYGSPTSKNHKSTKCPMCRDVLSTLNSQNGKRSSSPPEIRNCRFCYDDISWLPKNFPCPRCGNKESSSLKKEYRDTLKMIRQLSRQDTCK